MQIICQLCTTVPLISLKQKGKKGVTKQFLHFHVSYIQIKHRSTYFCLNDNNNQKRRLKQKLLVMEYAACISAG